MPAPLACLSHPRMLVQAELAELDAAVQAAGDVPALVDALVNRAHYHLRSGWHSQAKEDCDVARGLSQGCVRQVLTTCIEHRLSIRAEHFPSMLALLAPGLGRCFRARS